MEIITLTTENISQHLERCVEIQKHLVKDSDLILEDRFVATAEDTHTYFLGICNEGILMGVGVLSKIVHPVNTTGYINNIVVHPDARGKGYFSVIMGNLETQAKTWGCTDIALTCSREEVQGMYEKRGYTHKQTNFYILKLQ